MKPNKISRRDALGVIGKSGAALGTGTLFFLSLKTAPLAGAAKDGPQRQAPPRPAEKVMIGGSGPILTVKVSGLEGRYCGVAFAAADVQESYRPAPGARGRIGKTGTAAISLNVKDLPEGKVFLRIVTSRTDRFDADIAGTEAFVVNISKGSIAGYDGLTSRPLESLQGSKEACASFAAACYTAKR
jgi:hypothetical protein